MRCYCYYMPVGLYDEESQRKLIDVWERSWRKSGYEPIVLNEGDAKQHPMYDKFNENVSKLPSEYGPNYDRACFMRWLAMAAQTDGKYGGGLMLDYDVISYGFPVIEPDPDKMKIYCEHPPVPIDMGAVLGTREQYEAMASIYANWTPDQGDWNKSKTYNGYHCSDLSLLVRMFEHKNYPKPPWLVKEFGYSGRFPRPSYKTAQIVHYGYDMKLAGHWPKWQHIERLRPF